MNDTIVSRNVASITAQRRRRNLKLFINRAGRGFKEVTSWLGRPIPEATSYIVGFVYNTSLFTACRGTSNDITYGVFVDITDEEFDVVCRGLPEFGFSLTPEGCLRCSRTTALYKGEIYYGIEELGRAMGYAPLPSTETLVSVYKSLPAVVSYCGEDVIQTERDICGLRMRLWPYEQPLWELFPDWQFLIDLHEVPVGGVPDNVVEEFTQLLVQGYLPIDKGWVTLASKGFSVSKNPKSKEKIPFSLYRHLGLFYPYRSNPKESSSVRNWLSGIRDLKRKFVRKDPCCPFDFIVGHSKPTTTELENDYIVEMDFSFITSLSKENMHEIAEKNLREIWEYFLEVLSTYQTLKVPVTYLKPTRITVLNSKHLHIMAQLKGGK